MSDRYNALVVILEQDLRLEGAQALIEAIKQLRGVIAVEPNVADFEQTVAYERARAELARKLVQILYNKENGSPYEAPPA